MTIREAWEALEREQGDSGRVMRRIYPDTPFDLHVGVEFPSRRRQLIFVRAWSPADSLPVLPTTTALSCYAKTREGGRRIELVVELTEPTLADVFTPVVDDISRAMAGTLTESSATETMFRELDRWITLFQQLSMGGLDSTTQRGIVGELTVLAEYVVPILGPDRAIAAWTGPLRTNQDFQLAGMAIEVKVTTAKQPQGFVVANERELDATGVGDLWLIHLSLDERRGGTGRNLNQLVVAVRQLLQGSIGAVSDFDQKLTRIGYLEAQKAAYDEPHYEVRKETLLRVSGDFPCITEAMLPRGVGDVRYRVALSACEPYIAGERDLRNRLQSELTA